MQRGMILGLARVAYREQWGCQHTPHSEVREVLLIGHPIPNLEPAFPHNAKVK
jgi:hypothetical protein